MSAPPGTQTYKEENQKSTLHHHSVIEKNNLVWKTSHWSPTLEAALNESNPCFSSLSISHSSLASTSLLYFKDIDTAFDIQHKFQGSSCLPLNTCKISVLAPSPISKSSQLTFSPVSVCFLKRASLSLWKIDSFLSALNPNFLPFFFCHHSIT